MNRINKQVKRNLVVGCVGALLAACGAGTAVSEKPGASLRADGPNSAADQASTSQTAEPVSGGHVFEPRRHPPRIHPKAPPPPPPNELPRLVTRMAQCYEHPRTLGWSGAPGVPVQPMPMPGGAVRRRPSPSPQSAPPVRSARGAGGPAADAAAAPREHEAKRKRSTPSRAPAEPVARAPISESAAPPDAIVEQEPTGYHDFGASIYLSNDDTMSLSSAQRVTYAIDHFLPLPAAHIRPHEMLNYFSFDTLEVAKENDFSVLAGLAEVPGKPGIYSLALSVSGRPVTKATRRNVALSIVVDRSGSMSAEGRMDYLKRGLITMLDELKRGDLIHLVLFDHTVCTPVENFVVGRDPLSVLKDAIERMQPRGSTDLHRGMEHGYALADKTHRASYSNRVLVITDALTNTGITDPALISTIGKYYDSRRIRLSGVGVGSEFNDALLDKLTERGKGAYVFLGSEAEVDAVFGSRFVSLVETTALDVHFQLHLPPSLRMNVFYGEESSTFKEDVQAIHYFANTSQLFLQDLMAKNNRLRHQDQIMLSIEYEHPETGTEMVEEYAFTLGDILEKPNNVLKGQLIMEFVDRLKAMAERQVHGSPRPGGFHDDESAAACAEGTQRLKELSQRLESDPEVRRIQNLWAKYCSRFEPVRRPVERHGSAPKDAWPGAR